VSPKRTETLKRGGNQSWVTHERTKWHALTFIFSRCAGLGAPWRAQVGVLYTGRLNNEKGPIFDKCRDAKKPFSFQLGLPKATPLLPLDCG